ncbi:MAG: DUF6794 domain-containing protein [Saprospiraceae bacterium]
MKICSYLLVFIFLAGLLQAQNSNKDSLYQTNIAKSKLYGFYIPRDIDDALQVIDNNTTEEGRASLRTIDEETMSKKLYFGLGRWMEYQWNFVEGSRFSHYLREKGLRYVEDMVRFMLITYHRHNVKMPLNSDELIKQLNLERDKKLEKERPIISEMVRHKPSE